MSLFSSPPDSLCILRLSAIGDVCNTIAAVQAIQRQWPNTHIVWITGQLEAKLLEGIKDIEVIVFDKKSGWQGYQNYGEHCKDVGLTPSCTCNMPLEPVLPLWVLTPRINSALTG